MPIQIIWGNDLNACNKFIKKIIDQKVSKIWIEINVSYLNGDDDNQIKQAFDEILTPPLGDGSRVVVLKNNPIFTNKNEDIRIKFEKIYQNIPDNTYFILQNIKKPDSRLKSTKFIQNLIKKDLVLETSFSLPDIWDYEGQKRYLEVTANSMNIQLGEGAAELIMKSIGNDSFNLRNELAKAKIYLSASNRNETKELILKVDEIKNIFNDHQSNIFKIIDHLLQNNINESLIDIHYLLKKGEPALRLNAGLISQIRIHTIVKLLHKSGEQDLPTICKIANISNPKRIFFIRKKVNNTSSNFLIKLMSNLLDIEFSLKKGNNPFNVFTEHLVNLS
ncbi:DNA polymerase III, delta subunit [Prochlorococcus marinus str. MIT 9515]|uniref:DNA polymerase III subunit delta n=1 Tax=Prochlorococcus marinus (strain MIT 9515) TaxID=167542 RepID=A2BZ33_PROM5|nr:DNA polymerase III subunit delta [Prochlorococcus marinus]ABM73044.1 DNA polymerase III, delta subunit [Prochlorococcus marinus str. MIT 9515]